MTSSRQIAANRRNTVRSTGPRTPEGKARARENAVKHGLAIDVIHDPAATEQIERLARAFTGEASDPQCLAMARKAAVAYLELVRVRRYRIAIINTEIAAISQQQRSVLGALDDKKISELKIDAMNCTLHQGAKLERYERRAFSRYKKAMRELSRPATDTCLEVITQELISEKS